ncbi:Acyl-CoA Delta-9 desaturase [Anthophora retusa]
MAPNLFGTSATLYLEASQQDVHQEKSTTEKVNSQNLLIQKSSTPNKKYQWKIVWRNLIAFLYLHLGSLYGIYCLFTEGSIYTLAWSNIELHDRRVTCFSIESISRMINISRATFLSFSLVVVIISVVHDYIAVVAGMAGVGTTAGAHRLWAHRAYKARWPMRLLLMICQTVAFQNHIYEWVRDHRVHHKFTDTDADPHNAQRGFFFSHIGWLMVKKHPDVMKKGATVDLSDLEQDPIVVWQRRLYIVLMPLLCFILPVWVPCYFWNEKLLVSWYCTVFRYTFSLNMTWLVNSAAHIWGMKPYDKTIGPTENKVVAVLAFGEGWHNYHHVFPWDYKAAELGNYKMNITTAFIDFFARLGMAYDMKTVPIDVVMKRASRTGDGSKYSKPNTIHHHSHEGSKWGWGDTDMLPEEIEEVQIINKID